MNERAQSGESQAFTIVELLVVIAIIAILAAILLPTLSRAKESAKSARCKSNLKQIAAGLRLYLDEFDNYPPYITPGIGTNNPGWWNDSLRPYCGGDPKLFSCPAKGDYQYNIAGSGPFSWEDERHFGLSGGRFDDSPSPQLVPVLIPESRVVAPSDMLAVGELWGFGWPGRLYSGEIDLPRPFPHGRILNALFCDGHVEESNPDSLPKSGQSDHPEFKPDEARTRRWNNDNEPHPETWP